MAHKLVLEEAQKAADEWRVKDDDSQQERDGGQPKPSDAAGDAKRAEDKEKAHHRWDDPEDLKSMDEDSDDGGDPEDLAEAKRAYQEHQQAVRDSKKKAGDLWEEVVSKRRRKDLANKTAKAEPYLVHGASTNAPGSGSGQVHAPANGDLHAAHHLG